MNRFIPFDTNLKDTPSQNVHPHQSGSWSLMDTEIVWRFFLGKVAIIAAFAEKPRALKLGQTDRTTIRFRHGLKSITILALDFVRSAQISVFGGCATPGKIPSAIARLPPLVLLKAMQVRGDHGSIRYPRWLSWLVTCWILGFMEEPIVAGGLPTYNLGGLQHTKIDYPFTYAWFLRRGWFEDLLSTTMSVYHLS